MHLLLDVSSRHFGGNETQREKKGRIRDGAGIKRGRRQSDSMKLCPIRLSVCLAVSQHSEQGSAGCESPPVCSLKPLQAGRGEGMGRGVQFQLWPRPRHFNRLTLLTTFPKTLKHAWKRLSAPCQLRSEKCSQSETHLHRRVPFYLHPYVFIQDGQLFVIFPTVCTH